MAAQREYRTMATMTAEEATARIVQPEVDQSITKTELLDALRELEQQKRNIGDNIDMAFASVNNRLDALINDTSRELSNLNNANKELLNRTSNAVDTLDVRLKAVENWVQHCVGQVQAMELIETEASTGKKVTCPSKIQFPKLYRTIRRNGVHGNAMCWDISTLLLVA